MIVNVKQVIDRLKIQISRMTEEFISNGQYLDLNGRNHKNLVGIRSACFELDSLASNMNL